jgi:broad specificity phosphatase PhoE
MNFQLESIILVRHGRSIANDDVAVYKHMPDHVIPLSRPDDDPGAVLAGEAIAALGLAATDVCAWSSPYLRCQQTEAIVLRSAFGDAAATIRRRVSFLVREQEFGDWDSLTDEEIAARDPVRWARRTLLQDNDGKFYFRYPSGESRADVTQRMSIFISKIHRSRYPHHVVTLHGVTQRALRMSWLDRSVDWFEEEPNPANGSVLLLRRDASDRWVERYLP